ncbi:hypothetical protein BGW38_000530 [Lunasporangiospora selenospora]|uniref:RRM domain-containing protein n=1 Tax=Lunasporangiospora selenospora TaxID=979761 RepID=A0A9P6KES3_9FUNG|nr:hypothetical protein BGW38_000530 [Lunasporangiospora selenospora]
MAKVSRDILDSENDGVLLVSVAHPRVSGNELLRLLSSYGDIQSFQLESEGWPTVALVEYYDTRHATLVSSVLKDMDSTGKVQCNVSFYWKEKESFGIRAQLSRLDLPSPHESNSGRAALPLWSFNPQEQTEITRIETVNHPAIDWENSHTPSRFSRRATSAPCLAKDLSRSLSNGLKPDDHAHRETVEAETFRRAESARVTRGTRSWSSPCSSSAKPSLTAQAILPSFSAVEGSSEENLFTDEAFPPNVANNTRTTFMIRNIPNKYTQQMLLDLLNKTHFGQFDFLYLRMDFKNKCNVGYAFINFINVEVVPTFTKEHVGKRWPKFNSEKICTLSYAKVQGREALIEKFRNSCVMDEDPSYRPLIFYTSGPKVGLPEPFPQPTSVKEWTTRDHHAKRRPLGHRAGEH